MDTNMNKTIQICTFYLDALFLGIDVQEVQEVIRYQEMTPVPLAPPVIAGLINLRGQIVTATDLRLLLGLPGIDLEARQPMNVVIRNEQRTISLLVDEIAEVIEVDPSDFEPPPDTLPPGLSKTALGVYKLPQALLLLLNADELFEDGIANNAA